MPPAEQTDRLHLLRAGYEGAALRYVCERNTFLCVGARATGEPRLSLLIRHDMFVTASFVYETSGS